MFRTHWWPRAQWEGVGQRLAWYVVPDAATRREVAHLQARLAAPHLDPVPFDWVHVTVETHALDVATLAPATVAAIVASARAELAGNTGFEASCDRLEVWEEGVVWLLEPVGAFHALREAVLRATVAHVMLDPPRPFVPHLTVSYANAAAPDHEARAVAATAGSGPRFAVTAVALVALRQEARRYVWDELARVPLSG